MSLEKIFHMNIFKIERTPDSQKVEFSSPKKHFFKLWSVGSIKSNFYGLKLDIVFHLFTT